MRTYHLFSLFLLVLVWGCAASVDVESMFRDFEDYEKDVRTVSTDQQAMEILEMGRQKRDEAGALVDQGKKKEAVPIVEQALADARVALEIDKMNTSVQRAEQCRLEVEQARTKWREALFVLEQTEEFVGNEASISKREPESKQETPVLPESTLLPDSFPPATIDEVSTQWTAWRRVASDRKVAAADLESTFRRNQAQTQAEKVDSATVWHHTYLAARAVQSLECRVHAQASEHECLEAARLTADFGDARAEALRATLDLERGLQDDLRSELDQLRAEAKTRQDELFNALSQMEGEVARIRRDARGTIVSLADILFDFDKATLRRDVEFNLVKIATILNQFEEMKIVIEGHTDSIGPDEYNLGLSQRRASAVYEFLISQNVDERRMSWEGYGESRPVDDNSTDEGRQRNRRVDLVIQDTP
ncbi:MAG: OmpA family protein [Candidatus Latescibacteria bacterium]|nr:OmpA family protein [Candidatus Latescibacterota bacterium]NIO56204.1 OmpA family protein [Candidatus Latescibacterota bacterium]